MDISILSKNSIKIRSRHASIIVDPSVDGSKVSSDAVILLNYNNVDLSRAMDYRIVINGPGEYEISGVKVLGIKGDRGFVYSMAADGLSVIFGKSSEVSKIKDDTFLCQIAILNVDDEFSSSIVTKLEPKIVVLYGDNKESGAKILGKESTPPIKKFTITKEKVPEEMEVVMLG